MSLAHPVVAISWPCLAEQVSVTLHFYNPLAHWLTARLRLEQELAADAGSASLSGGKQAYLAALAQMRLAVIAVHLHGRRGLSSPLGAPS